MRTTSLEKTKYTQNAAKTYRKQLRNRPATGNFFGIPNVEEVETLTANRTARWIYVSQTAPFHCNRRQCVWKKEANYMKMTIFYLQFLCHWFDGSDALLRRYWTRDIWYSSTIPMESLVCVCVLRVFAPSETKIVSEFIPLLFEWAETPQ